MPPAPGERAAVGRREAERERGGDGGVGVVQRASERSPSSSGLGPEGGVVYEFLLFDSSRFIDGSSSAFLRIDPFFRSSI